jgi:hypothetical protein
VEFGKFLAVTFDLSHALNIRRDSGADVNFDIKLFIYPTTTTVSLGVYFINNHVWVHKLTSGVLEVPGAFVMPSSCDAGSPGERVPFCTYKFNNAYCPSVRPSHIRSYIPCIHTSLIGVSSVSVVCAFVLPVETRVLCGPVRDSN